MMGYDVGGKGEREYVIDGVTGELVGESKVRMDSKIVKVVPYASTVNVTQRSNNPTQPVPYTPTPPPQILRPSHYI
jgi:hypothetical protein